MTWLQPAEQRASVAEKHCDEDTITGIVGCIVGGLIIVGFVYFLVTDPAGFLGRFIGDMLVYVIVGVGLLILGGILWLVGILLT